MTNCLANNFPDTFATAPPVDGSAHPAPSERVLVKVMRNMGKEFEFLRVYDTAVL